MYESGLSTGARVLFLILAILLGIIFIMTSGCSCANADEIQIVGDKATHCFF